MIKSFIVFLRSFPISVIAWKLKCKVFHLKITNSDKWKDIVKGKRGIEIGGPSSIFKNDGYLPIYEDIYTLDGVNFSNQTVWEGSIREGYNYFYLKNKDLGYQFIGEGANLNFIDDCRYDFLLSSNNLEHLANPIKALLEWKRILRKNGFIILVLPNKNANFDNRRPFTEFSHLLQDYQNNIDETDLTHLEEILRLHDLKRDPQAGNKEVFKNRCLNNYENRCLHHHVFNLPLLKQIFDYIEMQIVLSHTSKTDYIVAAQKVSN
jgi:SAM-dependent methyltransferase